MLVGRGGAYMKHFGGGAQIRVTNNNYSHQTHEKTRNIFLYSRDLMVIVANIPLCQL
jgi:hypothetical protein